MTPQSPGSATPQPRCERCRFVTCAICGGEFDEGEWVASQSCPECEQPKQSAGIRIAVREFQERGEAS